MEAAIMDDATFLDAIANTKQVDLSNVALNENKESNGYTVPALDEDVGASLPNAEEARLYEQQERRNSFEQGDEDFFVGGAADGMDDIYESRTPKTSPWANWVLAVGIMALMIVTILSAAFGGNRNSYDSGYGIAERGPSPVIEPTEDVEQDIKEVIQYLVSQEISDASAFESKETNQYKAARWLASWDQSRIPVPSVSVEWTEGYMYAARYIMALNWYAMGGDNWKVQHNFMSGKNVCEWSTSYAGGVFCEHGLVVGLDLNSNALENTLPTENGKLVTLKELIIQRNEISGTIPSELCQLTQLKILALDNNGLSGNIPSCVDELRSLTSLTVMRNQLTGAPPHDSICALTNMKKLHLGDNEFDGELPDCYKDLQELEVLYLSNTGMQGEFPNLGEMPNLKELYLDYNNFSGEENFLLGFTGARVIVANENDFSFDIATLGYGMNQLEKLDLSKNKLVSSDGIPTHLINLPKLEVLDLAKNDIEGTVPVDISPTCNLEFLALYKNKLSGIIPDTIKHCSNLVHLDFTRNSFTGTLPSEIGALTNLEVLHISNNPSMESGEIPETFENLVGLKELALHNINLETSIPAFFADLENLRLLDLDNNSLFGIIPESLGDHKNIEHIILSRNKYLTGVLPKSFGNLTTLVNLFIDGTSELGDVNFMCDLPNFETGYDENDDDPDGLIVADCAGEVPKAKCRCCKCCNVDTDGIDGCSRVEVDDLHWEWEHDKGRPNDNYDSRVESEMKD